MSAPWHAAVRGVHGLDQRGDGDWPKCICEGCSGRILHDSGNPDGPERCFAHADENQCAAVLVVMKLRAHVDVRGTELTAGEVTRILETVGEAGRYDFRGCTFTGDTAFPGSQLTIETDPASGYRETTGVVDFGNATFNAGADFTKVTFPGPVFFDGTTFTGPVMLDRARFHDAVWFLRTVEQIVESEGKRAGATDWVTPGSGGATAWTRYVRLANSESPACVQAWLSSDFGTLNFHTNGARVCA
jgi:hypothetical protein